MRRIGLISAVMFACLALPAAAADRGVKIADFSYSPTTVNANLGDTVTWTWAGPDTNHSVTANSGQAESFDSDPGGTPATIDHVAGSTFQHTFTHAGAFSFHCRVHSFMTGKVVVSGPGGPDVTAPAISSLKSSGLRRRVSFTLSEAAAVKVAVKPLSRKGRTRTVKATGRRGSNRVSLKSLKLKPGRYRATVRATDAAGNRSRAKSTTFRVPAA
jgi:plastocyanin